MKPYRDYIKTLEFPFCYYAYIIDRDGAVDYMHYGLWESGTAGWKDAQENLARMMKSLIPAGVRRVLDVGCGLGRTTHDLEEAGYDVIGISPDVRLMEWAGEKYETCRRRLVVSSFEAYREQEVFDLVLFQESSQYIADVASLFAHCRDLTNASGYMLMCDEIAYEPVAAHAFHEKKALVSAAADAGYSLLLNTDITAAVLETRYVALRFLLEHGDDVIRDFSAVRGNVRQEIENLIEGMKLDTSRFEARIFGYEIFLFGRSGETAPEGKITFRCYRPGDEIEIVKLFQAIFGREMSLEEWRWKYTGRGNGKVHSTVAVSETNGIVAHYGGMQHRMVYQGREINGVSIGDVMVDPRYRGRTLFKKVSSLFPAEATKEGIFLGYGFPNARALRLPEMLGIYEKVEDVYAGTKAVKQWNNSARYIYKLFQLTYDDGRIDRLWEEVRNSYHLAVIRNRDYLAWRYQRNPLFSYELWGLRKRWSRKLRGIAVLRRDGEKVLIIDYICPDRLIDVLFQKIENTAYAAGQKQLTIWHPEFLKEKMQRMGFSVEYAGTSVPRSTHEGWLTRDQIAGNFFYTMGDTDFN
jgi:SAM-dependent methyltransferase